MREAIKVTTMGAGWHPPGHPKHVPGLAFNGHAERAIKASADGLGGYGGSFGWDDTPLRRGNSKSSARKAVSAQIAKIPFTLAHHIGRAWHPEGC